MADSRRIKEVARRVAETVRKGNEVVVVVSAMAGETDEMIRLSQDITDAPDEREMDLLLSSGERKSSALTAMALQKLGVESMSLTGRQVGIITDSSHTKAMIERIEGRRLRRALKNGKVPVVAGFQGINRDSDVTTLGRGGSDTTAVAIAAELRADLCEIYTDVDGVYTTDPRICREARKMERISYDEMLEMASLGAKVLHSRAVEFAKKYHVNLVVRSSFDDSPGTLVAKEDEEMEKFVVSGVTADKNQARITIMGVPDKPGIAARLFKAVADANILVDMIVQNISTETKATDISFTVHRAEGRKALKIARHVRDELGAAGVTMNADVAKVSIVGVGMRSHFGVAAKMFKTLASKKINIMMISTSEIKISCVVDEKYMARAVKALHSAFVTPEKVK